MEIKHWLLWSHMHATQSRQINKEEATGLMKQNNPVVIHRNSLIEKALENASSYNDYELFDELLGIYSSPFDYDREYKDEYLNPGALNTKHVTYCGT